jgi:hypothetical protein
LAGVPQAASTHAGAMNSRQKRSTRIVRTPWVELYVLCVAIQPARNGFL